MSQSLPLRKVCPCAEMFRKSFLRAPSFYKINTLITMDDNAGPAGLVLVPGTFDFFGPEKQGK
ncbi:MAG: hypothetical protein WDN26_09720 [Chitinophagaceae bacterium]